MGLANQIAGLITADNLAGVLGGVAAIAVAVIGAGGIRARAVVKKGAAPPTIPPASKEILAAIDRHDATIRTEIDRVAAQLSDMRDRLIVVEDRLKR